MRNNAAIFVIGATGYIGRELLDRAKLDGVTYGTSSTETKGLITFNLDVASDFDYGRINPGDVVVLTAAISAPDVCARDHDRAWAVNVTGTVAFLDSAIVRGARVIFLSSDTVYGEREEEFDERASCHPAGEYAAMKREVEQHFAGNPAFKVIRLSYVFSREDKFTSYIAGCVQREEEADIFHPFFRAIVHRDDVVEGALALADCWNEIPEQVINFGGPKVLSRVEFAECLREVHFYDLRFEVTEPDADFFRNRPRFISMTSPIFERLLGRPPRSLCDAVRMEFASIQNI
jgi:dTDP-4-dehydrorhamnose reductase